MRIFFIFNSLTFNGTTENDSIDLLLKIIRKILLYIVSYTGDTMVYNKVYRKNLFYNILNCRNDIVIKRKKGVLVYYGQVNTISYFY
jgi:hypothetical protein